MNVNGITTNGYDNAAYTDTAVKNSTNKDNKTSTASFSKDAAVYEASSRTTTRQKSNAAVVAQMKHFRRWIRSEVKCVCTTQESWSYS